MLLVAHTETQRKRQDPTTPVDQRGVFAQQHEAWLSHELQSHRAFATAGGQQQQNAATGELLWRGLAEKRVHEHSSPEHRTKRVNKEVAKMFEKFPGTGPVATSGRDLPTATDR
jgi:hypothetical protein